MNVLIVGSGPTGLTAALELARQGAQVRIIEKRNSPSGYSRAVGILPNSLRLLQASGVSDQLIEQGVNIHNVSVYRNLSRTLDLSFTGTGVEPEGIVALAQDQTESVLRSALSEHSVEVEYGTELTKFSQNDAEVVAHFSNGEYAKFDYLLGADGIGSVTRQALGIDYVGFDLPETWSIADVDAHDWCEQGRLTLCVLDDSKVVVVAPMEEHRYRIVSNTDDALATLPLELNVEKIRRAGEFTISVRQAETYQQGRVFLAGDSAHCHSPVGGRGMNLGIADAADFAEKLLSGNAGMYNSSRHQAGLETIRLSERVRRTITSQNRFVNTGVAAMMNIANQVPLLNRTIAKQFLS